MTEDALLDALREAMAKQPAGDGLTVVELVAAMGKTSRNERPIRDALRFLMANGKAECVTITRPRLNGVVARTYGYRLKAS